MNIQTAVVTGANRGIGFELAKKLAKKRFRVVLACRSIVDAECSADKIINELSVPRDMVLPFVCDLDEESSIDSFCESIYEEVDFIDVLVNNAAVLLDKSEHLFDVDIKKFKKTHQTNYFGPYYLTSKLLPKMIERNCGCVLMISSGAGQLSQLINDMPSYRLSKHSLNGLTIMLANMVEGSNVQVFACDPGWVKTDMGGSDAIRTAEEAADDALELIVGRTKNYNGCLLNKNRIIDW